MSGKLGFSYTFMIVAVVAVALVVVGGLMAFYALTAVGGDVAPRIITPLGALFVVLGLLLITSKGD